MNIKGTAVRILPKYIEKHFANDYHSWLEKLPDSSRKIFESSIYPTQWFPLYDAAVVPTRVFGQLFFHSVEEAAFEVGRFSARDALSGIYKVFVSLSSVKFILRRATSMVKTYYDPVESTTELLEPRKVLFTFGRNSENEVLIYHRIRGWIYELVYITQDSEPQIDIELVQNPDNSISAKFYIQW